MALILLLKPTWVNDLLFVLIGVGLVYSGISDLVTTFVVANHAKKFIKLGNGTMVHDMNGFHVEGIDFDGDKFEMIKDVPSLYSVHVEYNYLFTHGDCVDLNTLEDTWYCYPEGKFAVTKMALATEELYFNYMKKIGKKLPKGMA
mgnify:CR=1 FL=1